MKYLIELIVFVVAICGFILGLISVESGKISMERFIFIIVGTAALTIIVGLSIHVYRNLKY